MLKLKNILCLALCVCMVFACMACTAKDTSSDKETPSSGTQGGTSDTDNSGDTTSSEDGTSSDTQSDTQSDTSSDTQSDNVSSDNSNITSSDGSSENVSSSTQSGDNSSTTSSEVTITDIVSGNVNIVEKALAQSTSEYDEAMLYNPDRGFRMEVRMCLDPSFWGQIDMMEELDEWRSFYATDNPRVAQTYFYLNGMPDQLPQYAFDRMQAYFDGCRERGIKIVLRFAYMLNQNESGTPGSTGEVTQAKMLTHIEQLDEILEENKDVIHVVQMGFVGAWGEWNGYSDSGDYAIDELEIIKSVFNMVPEDLFVQIRYMADHKKYASSLPKSQSSRLGLHNDGVLGYKVSYMESYGSRNWDYATSVTGTVPQDGEMMWGGHVYLDLMPGLSEYAFAENDKSTYELKWSNFAGMFAEHRYTTFSLHHSYKEIELNDGTQPFYTMYFWQSRYITASQLEDLDLFYSPGWFKSESGITVKRTAFEYIRDYLGYRIGLNNYSVKGEAGTGEKLDLNVNLTNYGFSSAFNITSGFAVLDENNKVVSFVEAGDPTEWHSRKLGAKATYKTVGFTGFANDTLLSYDVSVSITLPKTKGTYKIAFCAFSTDGNPVFFANDMPVINGYHVLTAVEVK